MSAHLWTPGVDTEVFHPGRRDEALRATWTDGDLTQVVVGYVGSLRKRHGVRRLAEVARVPGTRLVVIGDGPQQAWLRSRLPESVRFTGELKPRHAAAAIASLDLLVQPSTRTTCAHALREAAACGVPVVAPRAGGAIDVVEHLGTGVLYDPQQTRWPRRRRRGGRRRPPSSAPRRPRPRAHRAVGRGETPWTSWCASSTCRCSARAVDVAA